MGGYHFSEITFWWVALGIGLVVWLVVIALLTLLLRLVQDIDGGVIGVRDTLHRVAGNTSADLPDQRHRSRRRRSASTKACSTTCFSPGS